MTASPTKSIAEGASATLELKRSAGELRAATQTIRAFANGEGGRVIIGVERSGEFVGEQVSEQTLYQTRLDPPPADPRVAHPDTGPAAEKRGAQ
jgi:predicted HTH transcriptional regulator